MCDPNEKPDANEIFNRLWDEADGAEADAEEIALWTPTDEDIAEKGDDND